MSEHWEQRSVIELETELETYMTSSLSSGERIPSEREFAEMYDVSRHLIRTVLQRLANRGIITTRPGARARLNSPSEAASIAAQFLRRTRATVDELYEARAVVEGGAVAVLASRVRTQELLPEKLQPLKDVLDEIDRFGSEDGMNAAANRCDLDIDFHLQLVSTIGNRIVTDAQQSLLTPFREYPTLWVDRRAVRGWQAEHRSIVSHILAGDPAAAQCHVEIHLHGGRQRLNKLLGESAISASSQHGTPAQHDLTTKNRGNR